MIARFPGLCACGCRTPFRAGDQVERLGTGWARASCGAPSTSSRLPGASPAAEVLEILGRAKLSAQRATRTVLLAHRAAWTLVNGPIPEDRCVLHHCDNPRCVRAEPDGRGHLFLGDRADNARDMASKGRAHLQRRPRAFAGEKHWTHRRPELRRFKGPRPCCTCKAPSNPLIHGRCRTCDRYRRKHGGTDRPAHLFKTKEP